MTTQAFFVPSGDNFIATGLTRGPWSPDHQHAGPPGALLARALERALPHEPAMQIVRITLEILRPVPVGEVSVNADTLHAGRKMRLLEATLEAAGKTCIRGRAVAMRIADMALPDAPDLAEPPASPDRGEPFEFPFFQWDEGYHKAVEMRLVRGTFGHGPVAAWIRMRGPLVAGETPSPLQRVMTAADSGNGLSVVLDVREHTFINPDLTVYVHRLPATEWVCLDAVTTPQPTGIGLADTRLYDERGPIGRSDQSLIIQPR